jgi:hypothetical protein
MEISSFMEGIRAKHTHCKITEECSIYCQPITLIPKRYKDIYSKIFFAKENGILLHNRLVNDFGEKGYWYFDIPNSYIEGDILVVQPILSPIIQEAKQIRLDKTKKIYFEVSQYPFLCIGYFYFLKKNMDMAPSRIKFLPIYAKILKELHIYETTLKNILSPVTGVSADGVLMENYDVVMFEPFPDHINDMIDSFA